MSTVSTISVSGRMRVGVRVGMRLARGMLSGRTSRGLGSPVVRSGGAVRRGYLLWVGQVRPVIAVEVLVAAGSGGGRHLHAGRGLFVGERVVLGDG